MTPTDGPIDHDRPDHVPTGDDAGDSPDWDLSVQLDETTADEITTDEINAEARPAGEVPEEELPADDFSGDITPQDIARESVIAEEALASDEAYLEDETCEAAHATADDAEPVAAEAVTDVTNAAEDDGDGGHTDELVESYQAHILDDEEPESDYVAHVQTFARATAAEAVPPELAVAAANKSPIEVGPQPPAAPLVKLAGTDAMAIAMMSKPVTAGAPTSVSASTPASTPAASIPAQKPTSTAPPAAVTPTDIGDTDDLDAIAEDEAIANESEVADDVVAFDDVDEDAADAAEVSDATDRSDFTEAPDEPEPVWAEPLSADERLAAGESFAGDGPDDGESDDYEASYSPDADADDEDDHAYATAGSTGGGWTIPLLCLGIAIIAFCLIIPQADANRRLVYERASLRADLESIQTQVTMNDEFLRRLAGDATLAERLALRQLNLQRAGTKTLSVTMRDGGSSPFDLVKVTPPAAMPPYEPVGGKLAAICRDTRSRLYLMGTGLFILAAGLVLGVSTPRR